MSTPLRVLIVEDSEDDAAMLLRELRRGGYAVTYERVQTADAMEKALDSLPWDVVLSDYSMPEFSAPNALRVLQRKELDLPFIIISGTVGEDAAVDSMRAGAHDFFAKNHLTRLIPALKRELQEAEDRRRYRGMQHELQTLYNAVSYLFNADSLLQLGQQIVQAVVNEFIKTDCGLLLVSKDKRQMLRVARAGQQQVSTDAPLYIDGAGLVPEAVRTAKEIYARDVSIYPGYIGNVAGTRSELVIPLQTQKGVLGVLDLQSDKLDAFSEQDRRILRTFAERAASAIESKQLYEEINLHAAELESRVKERTAELQHAKENVETILNNSSDAILVVHPDGTIHQTNPAFSQLFGSEQEVRGQSITSIVAPSQVGVVKDTLRIVSDYKEERRIDFIALREDGTTFTAEAGLAPVVEGQQDVVICSVRDVTLRRQAEADLRSALEKEKELNELKSRFISMTSHEFRTPLTTISTASWILREHLDQLSGEERVKRFDRIHQAIGQMTTLMDEILTFGKATAGRLKFEPAPMDIGAFCTELVEELRVKTHTIIYTVEGGCADAMMDDKLLRHILPNLITNAIKYSPENSEVRFSLVCDDTNATFRVTDKGIGIPHKDQERIFESFHRAENVGRISGTGLGLAIAKRAVDAHGGTITFESREGVGTTFIVVLPLRYIPDAQ
jgi:PAS domain S-box-containing protein